MCVCVCVCVSKPCLVATMSLGGFVAEQMWYNFLSAQYL